MISFVERDWCLGIDVASAEGAERIGRALREELIDVDVEDHRSLVWCFAESEAAVRELADEIRQTLTEAALWDGLVLAGRLWVWNGELRRYVDPKHPEEETDRGGHPRPPAKVAEISVSTVARRRIHRHGGQLWVWGSPVGGDTMIRTSTSAGPAGVEFDRIRVGDVLVWFDPDLGIDDVKIGWTPMTGFDVTWPGTTSAAGGS